MVTANPNDKNVRFFGLNHHINRRTLRSRHRFYGSSNMRYGTPEMAVLNQRLYLESLFHFERRVLRHNSKNHTGRRYSTSVGNEEGASAYAPQSTKGHRSQLKAAPASRLL